MTSDNLANRKVTWRRNRIVKRIFIVTLRCFGLETKDAIGIARMLGRGLLAAAITAVAFFIFIKGPAAVQSLSNAGSQWTSLMLSAFGKRVPVTIQQLLPRYNVVDVQSPVDLSLRVLDSRSDPPGVPTIDQSELTITPSRTWAIVRPPSVAGNNPIVFTLNDLPAQDLPLLVDFKPKKDSKYGNTEVQLDLQGKIMDGFSAGDLSRWKTDVLGPEVAKNFTLRARGVGASNVALRIQAFHEPGPPSSIPVLWHTKGIDIPVRLVIGLEGFDGNEDLVVALGDTLLVFLSRGVDPQIEVYELRDWFLAEGGERRRRAHILASACGAFPSPEHGALMNDSVELGLVLAEDERIADKDANAPGHHYRLLIDAFAEGAPPIEIGVSLQDKLITPLAIGISAASKVVPPESIALFVNHVLANTNPTSPRGGRITSTYACR
jgi:hypothetical protein